MANSGGRASGYSEFPSSPIVSPLQSPVVVDGIVSDEKLAELLALQTEYPELDFKSSLDLTATADVVELAKDVGAMQVRGGYIVAGVDGQGKPTGALDGTDARRLDEANLVPKLLAYLPEPLELRTRVLQREGRTVAVIFVGRHPSGCVFFRAVGQYERNGRRVVAFRAGDVFWRNGTRSVRLSQQGFDEIVQRRVAQEKSAWLAEQHEIRRRELRHVEESHAARQRAEAPLGTVSFDLPASEVALSALEMVRARDVIGLRHLLNEGLSRARSAVAREEVDTELQDVVGKLSCLGATFLAYKQTDWFNEIVRTLSAIYSMPIRDGDAERSGYSTRIAPTETAPRVWLLVIENVYALGALAVRMGAWSAVRTLTLQKPERLSDYDANWLRHALTMASRAQHLVEQQGERTVELSLLSLARNAAMSSDCLRPDRVDEDDALTSLAQFDLLSNIAAIDGATSTERRVFYPNFARLYQTRVQPIVERLLVDPAMRDALFFGTGQQLADALAVIGEVAEREGWRYDGFVGWGSTPVGQYIAEHASPPEQ
jgi:hypothetical protein